MEEKSSEEQLKHLGLQPIPKRDINVKFARMKNENILSLGNPFLGYLRTAMLKNFKKSRHEIT